MALTGGSFLTLALNMIAPQVFTLIDSRHPYPSQLSSSVHSLHHEIDGDSSFGNDLQLKRCPRRGFGRWAARFVCLLIAGSAVYVMLLVGEMEASHHDHHHHDHHDHHHAHQGHVLSWTTILDSARETWCVFELQGSWACRKSSQVSLVHLQRRRSPCTYPRRDVSKFGSESAQNVCLNLP
eukprot:3950364-Amphidinium_carterae.1